MYYHWLGADGAASRTWVELLSDGKRLDFHPDILALLTPGSFRRCPAPSDRLSPIARYSFDFAHRWLARNVK